MTDDRSPARAVLRFVWCAIAVPVVLTAVAVTVQLILLPQVPSTIAVHWNAAGAADGFGPSWVQLLATIGFGLGLPLLLALTTLPGLRRGDRGASYRLMGAVSPALSVLIAVLMTGTLLGQVGLASAVEAPSVVPVMIAAFAASIVVGLGAWFVQPAEELLRVGVDTSQPLALAPGERAVWFGSSTIGRSALILIAGACLFVTGAATVMWIAGEPAAAWICTILAAVLIALAATVTAFRVRIDDSGVTAVSVLGVPRFHVPIDDVVAVAVRNVNPMGEFGGWGMRSAPGRFGLVMRTGAALDVERRSGRRFIVTVDEDAVTAGALLAALADPAVRRS